MQLFRRLNSELMTETVEEQLLAMKFHLMKVNKYRTSKQAAAKQMEGKLELSIVKGKVSHHMVVLYPANKSDVNLPMYKKPDRRIMDSTPSHASMNQEWRTMFAVQHDNANQVKDEFIYFIKRSNFV